MQRIAIERKGGLSAAEFVRDHVHGVGRPVILTDAIQSWPARSKWTFDWLRDRFGRDHATAQMGLFSGAAKLTTLGTYIDHVDAPDGMPGIWLNKKDGTPLGEAPPAASSPLYLLGWNAFGRHPELFDDMEPLPACIPDDTAALDAETRAAIEGESGREYWSLYLGPVNSLSHLHQDFWHTHAYLAQIAGRKRAMLFAPGDTAHLYQGRVDPETPDLARYPRFVDATMYEGEFGPGELLFIPADWWHHVRGLETTITVSHNFFSDANRVRHLAHLSAALRARVEPA